MYKDNENQIKYTKLKSKRTNLKTDLLVEEDGFNQPKVQVYTINSGIISISISDNPIPLDSIDDFKQEDIDIINDSIYYVKRNKDILLQFYKNKIDIDDFLDILSERGDYKRNKNSNHD